MTYPGFSLYHATKWGIEGFVPQPTRRIGVPSRNRSTHGTRGIQVCESPGLICAVKVWRISARRNSGVDNQAETLLSTTY